MVTSAKKKVSLSMEKVVQDFYDLFMEYYKKFVESPFEMFLAAVKILTFVESFHLKSTLLLYKSFLISKHVRYDFSNYIPRKIFSFHNFARIDFKEY